MAEPLTRYTPSLMSRDALEAIFVVRRQLLDRIVERVAAAATSLARNHTLLVGPRGSGKTHMTALAYYRTRDLIVGGARLQTSWLPEDPWSIASYGHLLAAILAPLAPDLGDRPIPRWRPEELEALLLQRAAADGPIVVFVENLDQVLDQIGDLGQQRLRHLLQDRRPLLLVATTTRLDRSFSDQAAPFYGFFTTSRLEPFTAGDAQDMLSAIAVYQGDAALADWVRSPDGTNRIRAVAHLAGGQPRLWAALGTALTIDDVGRLVDSLMTKFDDLTPYYQEQLARLSPQQRLVVIDLAQADHPLHVAELADRLGLEQRSVGKAVSDLVDRGWLLPIRTPVEDLLDRRRTYYELAEPLARVAFQIKETRDAPLRVVVDFLTTFFDPDQIRSADRTDLYAPYLASAELALETDEIRSVARRLSRLPLSRVPAVRLLGDVDDALAALRRGRADEFLRLPAAVRTVLEERLCHRASRNADAQAVRLEIHGYAGDEMGVVPHPDIAHWLDRSEDLLADDPGDVSARLNHASWLARGWRFDEAEAVISSTAITSQTSAYVAARSIQVDALFAAGKQWRAISSLNEIVAARERELGADDPATLASRDKLAMAQASVGHTDEALDLLTAGVSARTRSLGIHHPDTLTAMSNLAVTYAASGRTDQAVPIFQEVADAREQVLGPDHPQTLSSLNRLAVALASGNRPEEALPLFERVLAARERLLSGDDLEVLTSRNNLGVTYSSLRRRQEALPLFEQVAAARERLLGPDHPDTLGSQDNLAATYASLGFSDRATQLFRHVLTARERVLGPEHPDTIRSERHLLAAEVWAR